MKKGFRYYAGEWVTDHITVVDKTLDWSVGIHMHSFFEIEIIMSGRGQHNLNGISYSIEEGSLVFLTPIDFHSIEPDGSARIINISFDSEMIPPELQLRFMNRRENMLFKLEQAEIENILNVVNLLKKECDSDDSFSRAMREHLLGVILGSIARMAQNEAKLGSNFQNHVQESVKFLFDHFRDDITLAQVASASGYTPNYFSKLFSDLTGRRYIDFLNNLRINYAKMLLITTKRSVTDIARTSGFSSLSNFARAFKEEVGMPPSAYRKANESKTGDE